MTSKQHQCLLACLDYYHGPLDGIWGDGSRAGARRFQQEKGLTADGIFGPESETAILAAIAALGRQAEPWDRWPHFTRQEFACRCSRFCDGFPAEVSQTLLDLAEMVRSHFASPVILSSGLRCPQHNANVGGVSNSYHLTGRAMDFQVAGRSAGEVLAYLQQLPQVRYAYAIDSQFVHMDVA